MTNEHREDSDKILSRVEKSRIKDRTTELHKIHEIRPWSEAEKEEWVNLNEQWFESTSAQIRAERAARELKKNDDARYNVCGEYIEGRHMKWRV